MKLFFNCSGFHPTLPYSEIKAIASVYGRYKVIGLFGRNMIMEFGSGVECFLNRLALTHAIYRYHGSCEKHISKECLNNISINVKMPYRVRIHGYRNVSEIIDIVVEYVEERYSIHSVSLEKPETSIDIFFHNSRFYITTFIANINKDFMRHAPKHRPFTRPISMDPRIARAMVNLARLKGGALLDPFCGTGGILLEASSMGFKAFGIEKDSVVAEGAKRNIEHFNYDAEIVNDDALNAVEIFGKTRFDAVVTDMPYGLSASLKGRDKERLYDEAIDVIEEVLKKNRYAVIMIPKEINLNTKMKLIETHEQRVHNTLTRKICVFKK